MSKTTNSEHYLFPKGSIKNIESSESDRSFYITPILFAIIFGWLANQATNLKELNQNLVEDTNDYSVQIEDQQQLIQEQEAQIEDLESRMNDLESQSSDYEWDISEIKDVLNL